MDLVDQVVSHDYSVLFIEFCMELSYYSTINQKKSSAILVILHNLKYFLHFDGFYIEKLIFTCRKPLINGRKWYII